MMRPMSMRAVLAVAAVLAVLLVGCGDDDSGSDATVEPSDYPPTTVEELAEVFDPQLEPLGVRLTRAALIDRSDGGYVPSEQGEHLALYVEPIDSADYTTADYVEAIGTVTAVVTPEVFDRWSGVETYDICQEPPPEVDDREEPAPYTQVEIDRATAASVDWSEATTATVIGLSQTGAARLIVTPTVSAEPTYQEGFASAG